jgi:dynein light intermediate chain 1
MNLDGASLIYTSQGTTSQLPILIHSTLGITSLLKRQPLKHNVIDRDKIVVPPNWDSWGKIRVLGGSFDTEKVSQYWAEDIKIPLGAPPPSIALPDPEDDDENGPGQPPQVESAIALYEDWCKNPNSGGLALVESAMNEGTEVAVESEDTQEFLERQLKILEAYKSKVPEKTADGSASGAARRVDHSDEKTVNEHIGPVQFNMGGIQVDADDMLQRLKVNDYPLPFMKSKGSEPNHFFLSAQDRNAHIAADVPSTEPEAAVSNMAKDFDNEQLHDFFSGLMNRTAGAGDGR